MEPFWTDEKTKQAMKLWLDGFSSSEIGRVMGKSRNAIIGRMHRIGHKRNGPSVPVAKVDAPVVKEPAQQNVEVVKKSRPKTPRAVAKAPVSVEGSAPRPWTTRKWGECAYPVDIRNGDTYSCCQPVVFNKSYCKKHAEIMYAPLKQRRR